MKNRAHMFFKPVKLIAPALVLLATFSFQPALAADTTVDCGGIDQNGWYVAATQTVASHLTPTDGTYTFNSPYTGSLFGIGALDPSDAFLVREISYTPVGTN